MKGKYKYLVSFADDTGHCSAVVNTNKQIRSEEDIDRIARKIETDPQFSRVVITNFILLDTKWGAWEWFKAITEMFLLLFCILAMIASIFG